MKNLVTVLMLSTMLILNASAGGQSTIGNGKVDLVEAATIQVAVGLAFSAKPQTVVPAYAVTTALLKIMSNDTEQVQPSMIKILVVKELEKLKLDKLTMLSMIDLMNLVEAEIKTKIDIQVQDSNKMVIIKQVIQIIHDSSEVRIGITQTK